MDGPTLFFALIGFVMHETMLFAACGFLLLGFSDLTVDIIWIARKARRGLGRGQMLCADGVPAARSPGLMAVFIPAWDESFVIGDMIANSLRTFGSGDYVLFVGAYPNDPDTIAVVQSIADTRVRLVVGDVDGPTTKADCLNRLWLALGEEEARSGRRAKAIILHDAEDVVHPAELKLFDRLIEEYDLVQLPVLPLIGGASAISKTYADEFAESHGKELVVRQALGASIPSAGVGCAFARNALERVADESGRPFASDSLTEDYELGLRLHAAGARSTFVRLRGAPNAPIVSTREYFPGTIREAVSQRSRWMAGIALIGWDRLGWSGGLAERWMRLRDRQSLLASLLICAAYLSALLWGVLQTRALLIGDPIETPDGALGILLSVNFYILAWRLAIRAAFVTRAYGWREGLKSAPRLLLSNLITVWSAQRAIYRYLTIRRTGLTQWDKTAHRFPAALAAE